MWILATLPFFPIERALQPKGLLHSRGVAASGFLHCAIFPTAASRRSLDRVSVPVWLIILSDQLPIVGLVSHYLTNNLMGHGPIPSDSLQEEAIFNLARPSGISHRFQWLFPTKWYVPMHYSPVRHSTHPRRGLSRSTCMC